MTMAHTIGLGTPRPSASRLTAGVDAAYVLDRLLAVIAEMAPKSEPSEMSAFRARILEYRKGLASTPAGPDMTIVADACLDACEEYFDASHRHIDAREGELTEVILVLRQTAAAIARDSSQFTDQLLSSADTFGDMVQQEEVWALRRRLTAEAIMLRTAAEAKRECDQKTYARLTSCVEDLQARRVQADEGASIDPLTRLANRGLFDRTLGKMIDMSRQSAVPLSLAMIDIDNFTAVNDQHGQAIGDRILLSTALWLGKSVRPSDFVARHGGGAFAVIFLGAKARQLEPRTSQMLADLAANRVEYDAGSQRRAARYTASIGLAELVESDTPEDLVTRAHDALSDAKRQGKNRVVSRKRSMLSALLGRPSRLKVSA
jgi:diguanylate cyclase (GGDEF)-like protein